VREQRAAHEPDGRRRHGRRLGRGIGAEPLLQVEIPPTMRAKGIDIRVVRPPDDCGRFNVLHMGVMWVRTAPLTALYATAPYLHNGSVPTLRALLEPAKHRPVTFTVGTERFLFDTRVPGNRNIGHEFGTNLSAAQKADLVAFLNSL
jgi:cytochrome c peroxidase